jgi:DNA replication and repair protein RecF
VREREGRFAELSLAIGETPPAELRYQSSIDPAAVGAEDERAVAGVLRLQLERHRPLDVRRGVTHVGPHRDDLDLRLGGRALRTFGSAGQQRSAAMALRLLECETLRAGTGREPALLLDDPFAELDRGRAARVLALMTASRVGQTILAVPRADDIPRALTALARWRVRDGVLTERPDDAHA